MNELVYQGDKVLFFMKILNLVRRLVELWIRLSLMIELFLLKLMNLIDIMLRFMKIINIFHNKDIDPRIVKITDIKKIILIIDN